MVIVERIGYSYGYGYGYRVQIGVCGMREERFELGGGGQQRGSFICG